MSGPERCTTTPGRRWARRCPPGTAALLLLLLGVGCRHDLRSTGDAGDDGPVVGDARGLDSQPDAPRDARRDGASDAAADAGDAGTPDTSPPDQSTGDTLPRCGAISVYASAVCTPPDYALGAEMLCPGTERLTGTYPNSTQAWARGCSGSGIAAPNSLLCSAGLPGAVRLAPQSIATPQGDAPACAGGEQLVGGGCACSTGVLEASHPSATGQRWHCRCSAAPPGVLFTVSICAKWTAPSCLRVAGPGAPAKQIARQSCGGGELVVAGGCSVVGSELTTSHRSAGNGWECSAIDAKGTVTAWALCMRKQ